MANTTGSSGGLGFTSTLTLIFITLKLTDVIDWSWWWVLSPTLFHVAMFVALMAYIASTHNK